MQWSFGHFNTEWPRRDVIANKAVAPESHWNIDQLEMLVFASGMAVFPGDVSRAYNQIWITRSYWKRYIVQQIREKSCILW